MVDSSGKLTDEEIHKTVNVAESFNDEFHHKI